jgi:hypothetical protein
MDRLRELQTEARMQAGHDVILDAARQEAGEFFDQFDGSPDDDEGFDYFNEEGNLLTAEQVAELEAQGVELEDAEGFAEVDPDGFIAAFNELPDDRAQEVMTAMEQRGWEFT